ncbi:MAG: hypothetical protein M1833_006107 [Piccolia ochrophora]|nr:MAG: hypothetical protein M1833_006107 [Piccolia ochrophora]
MPFPSSASSTGLAITNPLVLYRSLVAGKSIAPDPAQHRLALHLQKLYFRLKDYEPELEYGHRLNQINRAVGETLVDSQSRKEDEIVAERQYGRRNRWFSSLLAEKDEKDALALTRVLTSQEAAINLNSPRGLLLHGEVGTGKSMLVDLLADSLPNKKKRRWHFNTFMLDTFARLEHFRRHGRRSTMVFGGVEALGEDYSLVWLAREMISTSPILFLDEFQLPDRTASKILSNLLTTFFHLGGVLIATSNRMPDELARAAGVEFTPPPSRPSLLGGRWANVWSRGADNNRGRSEGMFGGKSEFAGFLEVLKARCEVWDMEGSRDWRRQELDDLSSTEDTIVMPDSATTSGIDVLGISVERLDTTESVDPAQSATQPDSHSDNSALPKYYFLNDSASALDAAITTLIPSPTPSPPSNPWLPTNLIIYARPLHVPRAHPPEAALWTFSQLCATPLGPADYISLASTFRTFIITDVPILTSALKAEARRFITLLDALYECRCRLLIRAAATPDTLFFPSSPSPTANPDNHHDDPSPSDPTLAETLTSVHRDLTSPFRPNISRYAPTNASEDADFTTTAPPSTPHSTTSAPDFSHAPDLALAGADERFAFRRAQSRLYELCSARWATTAAWRPLPLEQRPWERSVDGASNTPVSSASASHARVRAAEDGGEEEEEVQAAPSHSPFRTSKEAPPRFGAEHAWGVVKWGRKAGRWGRGVDALAEEEGVERKGGGSGGGGR